MQFCSSAYLSSVLQSNVGVSWWAHSFWAPGVLLLLCQPWPRFGFPLLLLWLLLVQCSHWYLSVHLPFCSLVWLFFVFFIRVCLCKTAFVYHLDLLRLPILSLPSISCFSLPLWDFLLMTPCSISCHSKDNTDVWLYACLLLCANGLLFTVSAHAFIYKYGALY